MKRKTAGILLGVMISAAFLSGCGNNEATEAASESAETEKEGNGEDAETEEAIQKAEEERKETETASEETEEEKAEILGTVGVLLPDEEQEMYQQDSVNLTEALQESGYAAEVLYAEGNGEVQAKQVLQLVEQQADALIILPEDPYGLTEALASAKEAGIPVFSYDELIMDSDGVKYYTTFDTREIGQMLGNAIVKAKDLEKARENQESMTIEFLMGSPDDTPSLFLYNGIMEVLQPYLDDGTLTCRSGRMTFDETGILRWNQETAEKNLSEILTEFYGDRKLDIVCGAFDGAALGAQNALEEAGFVLGDEEWPVITGVGCSAESVKAIAEGKQTYSVFMDRRILAEKCVKMVTDLLKEEEPEVKDYEQYDNGKKIIGTYTCDVQLIDKDNYEILIDNGYYTEEEVALEEIPTPTPKEEETPTPTLKEEKDPTPTPKEEDPTPTPKEMPTSTPAAVQTSL